MRSDRKKPPDTTARAVRVVRGATGAQPSAASRQRIVRITRKAGNDQFGTALGQAAGRRDVLLAFTCSQLEKLHQLQGLELREIRDKHRVRGWYKETAKGALGYRLPDATRFHEAARLYKLTGTALANGELGRGAQLLERAMEAERALLRSLPRQVVDASSAEQRCEPTGPADAVGIAPGASAPEIPPPHGLRYADLILAVEAKMVHSPQRRRPGFEWWQAEEDEQEEEDEDDE